VGRYPRRVTDQPYLTNLPRFLEHLAPRDPESAQLAQLLLDNGWTVRGFWGPEQMDVWQLDLARHGLLVQFRIERGFAEWPRVVEALDPPHLDDYRPLGLAILAWARATGVPFRLDHPDDFQHDLVEHAPDALEWVSREGSRRFDRVYAAWREFRSDWNHSIPIADHLAALEASAR